MKIAIAGFGLEGRANYDYWQTPENDVTIVDENTKLEDVPAGAKTILGPDAFSRLDGFDLVIRTAGLAPRKIVTGGKIWTSTNEFFAKCTAPIIGVTGTKGKGTTCSLIASLLGATGKTVHLVGNIGTPALSELPKINPDDIVVFELSSFQLWDIEKSPHVAVVLMIEADHLNVHADMDEYVNAKANIVRFQTADDMVVFNENNQWSKAIAEQSAAGTRRAYPFDLGELASAVKLPGQHNLDNASAAVAAVSEYVSDAETLRKGLSSFEGLPHRLEFVRSVDGVRYYNDSFSSAPSATIAAVRSFEEPEIVIIGGIDKGADFGPLAEELVALSNLKKVLLVGEIRSTLQPLFAEAGLSEKLEMIEAKTMPEIVETARQQAEPGDVILLSPACASFDMFKNFYDRGDQFREVVKSL